MELTYKSKKLEKECTDYKKAVKSYGPSTAVKLPKELKNCPLHHHLMKWLNL